MLRVSFEQDHSLAELSALHKRLLENARRAVMGAALRLLEERKKKLLRDVISWVPSKECIERFPWFENRVATVRTYLDALSVRFNEEGDLEVTCDAEKLRRAGLPEDLGFLLEYGSDVSPPFPHIRDFGTRVSDEFA